jgi:hypothetical protein
MFIGTDALLSKLRLHTQGNLSMDFGTYASNSLRACCWCNLANVENEDVGRALGKDYFTDHGPSAISVAFQHWLVWQTHFRKLVSSDRC